MYIYIPGEIFDQFNSILEHPIQGIALIMPRDLYACDREHDVLLTDYRGRKWTVKFGFPDDYPGKICVCTDAQHAHVDSP